MSNFLNREQVVNMFGFEIYQHIKEEDISIKRFAWTKYLEALNSEDKITDAQMKVWVYPQKEMGRYE